MTPARCVDYSTPSIWVALRDVAGRERLHLRREDQRTAGLCGCDLRSARRPSRDGLPVCRNCVRVAQRTGAV